MATQTSRATAHLHEHEGLPEAKRDALKRLSYIEGHLAGIRRMVRSWPPTAHGKK